ncbi:MAG: F0F1 ATP synthase subunit alpha [Tractidigestivibacter sp.]|jgi:F-type H+-transporting ATPase subunit alpha|uniref:F0F1 ATP synthase subunit alpha n=1 Tax=Tractidigestivibacter sp. TaxID=2847320 RepID=UPI003D91C820
MADSTTPQIDGTPISSERIMKTLRKELAAINATVDQQEASVVTQVGDGIAYVSGLKSAMSGELLQFTSSATGRSVYGLAQNLEEDRVGAVLFGDVDSISEGDECRTTGHVMDIPTGHAMLGRVVNPLGQPIDGLGPINTTHRRPIEFKAPGIMERQPVCEPVLTGLLAIDAMVPIGRGQRELIIGDRKTGKTAIAIDTIINQRDTDMICIYVAIGQKASTVAAIKESLARHGVLDKTVIVAATAADSAPMQYIAPMAGAAIGEYFMYNDANGNPADKDHPGGHVLVVYDDLSKQAVAYRQMSLTLHRPPGREAYPGDIFYLHSRLLERACKLSDENGAGSLTALPIIETQEGDVSAYIPTNVISITDGQIYLQTSLFFQGQRPAVDVGISVSRVGGDAQYKAMKQVAGTLRLDLASYRDKQAFAQFGSDLDATTQYQLNHGAHMMELLKQGRYSAIAAPDEIIAIFAGKEGFLDDVDIDHVALFRDGLSKYMSNNHPQLRASVLNGKIDDDQSTRLRTHIAHFKEQFLLEHPNKAKATDVTKASENVTSDDAETTNKGQEK